MPIHFHAYGKAETPVTHAQSVDPLTSRGFQGFDIFMQRDALIDSSIFMARIDRTFR
jgi:hypothetical protein